MKPIPFLLNLAASLFVAPTPGLLIVLYANGGATIPPLQGLAVFAISAIGYWIWVMDRRTRRATEAHVERARRADIRAPVDDRADMLAERAHQETQSQLAVERRRAEQALRGHDDLVDPLAAAARSTPGSVLIDRVADLRQLKSLVSQHEARLLNAFHRCVARDEYGAPDYGDWAYEADRFLMSSAFMARTLNRHEAIATVTAEVEFMANAGAAASAAQGYRMPAPVAPAGMLAPPTSGSEAAPGTRPAARAMAPVPGSRQISDSLKRRLLSRRAPSFSADCARALEANGWDTQTTDSPGSDAIDLFAERGDLIVGLRCRASVSPVDLRTIEQVIAARDRFGLDAAGVVAMSGVETAARAQATVNGICLLEEADLPDLHLFVAHRKKVVPLFQGQARA